MTAPSAELRVSSLSARLIEPTARMLAHAMEVDPAYAYMFPSSRERARGLPAFFARNLRTHLPHRCTYVACDASERLIATVTLRPPGGVPISTLTMLRRGLLPFLLAHGHDPVRRLFWLKRTYDALELEAAQGGAHSHVHMMAVAPERQGAGIGSRLLARVLSLRPPVQTPLPTVLTTHLERNVVFYRRAGFQVVDERVLEPPGGRAYRVWSMRAD
jgi:GNAT superfamily N-acetyltransferase